MYSPTKWLYKKYSFYAYISVALCQIIHMILPAQNQDRTLDGDCLLALDVKSTQGVFFIISIYMKRSFQKLEFLFCIYVLEMLILESLFSRIWFISSTSQP